jgi:hypothetical protein
MAREMRAQKHRIYLAEKEKESVETSLAHAHELCSQYKGDAEAAVASCAALQETCEKLKYAQRMLEQRCADQDAELESVHTQLSEQQKLDSLERAQAQHEHFVQQLRDQYDANLFQMREQLAQAHADTNDKLDYIKRLRGELDAATRNAEMAALDKAEAVNRLTKSLNDLQNKYSQEVLGMNGAQYASGSKINAAEILLNEKNGIIEQLSAKCGQLEEQLNRVNVNLENSGNSNLDFHISALSNTLSQLNASNATTMADPTTKSLQNELERALAIIKQKRGEVAALHAELDQLRQHGASSNNSNELRIQGKYFNICNFKTSIKK